MTRGRLDSQVTPIDLSHGAWTLKPLLRGLAGSRARRHRRTGPTARAAHRRRTRRTRAARAWPRAPGHNFYLIHPTRRAVSEPPVWALAADADHHEQRPSRPVSPERRLGADDVSVKLQDGQARISLLRADRWRSAGWRQPAAGNRRRLVRPQTIVGVQSSGAWEELERERAAPGRGTTRWVSCWWRAGRTSARFEDEMPFEAIHECPKQTRWHPKWPPRSPPIEK